MHKIAGFTLMEMMIVIAMFAVMSGIAIPGFMNLLPGMRLNGAARQVMGDLMAARMKAVKENNPYKVFFLNTHEYKLLDDDDNDGVADEGEAAITKDIQAAFSGVTFGSTHDPIFYPRGTASDSPTITIRNTDGGCKQLDVSITGRVKIHDCVADQ